MPFTVPKFSIDKKGESERKKSLGKTSKSGSTFLGVGLHEVQVKKVEEATTRNGNVFFRITFESGSKSINMSVFMPDGTRPYNPKSANSVKLEGFLNSVLGLKIVPATDTYLEDLSAGLEYFTQPKTFIKRECKIKVDYPYSMLHAEEVSQGKFKLVYGNGKELDDTTFPSRDAAEAHVQSLNAERDEGNLLRFAKFPEVLFINPPENPQGVPALDTQLEDIEDEEDEVPGW